MITLRHVGITVVDMEKSLALYRDYFGLTVVWDQLEEGEFIDNLSGEKGVRVRTVKLRDEEGGMVELLQYYSHPRSNGANFTQKAMEVGCSHFALTVSDLDSVYGDLKKLGLRFNSSPKISVDGKAKVCFCRDFDGTLMELVEVIE